MTNDERNQRLLKMLDQVAGAHGIESLTFPEPDASEVTPMASVPDPVRVRAATALHKVRSGLALTPDDTRVMEAIVLPEKRPVAFIRNNVYDSLTMNEWTHLNRTEVRNRLQPWLPSVGRIELPTRTDIPYGGTGFVVGKNLLMTNRHVARLFTDGVGTRLTYFTGNSAVDFKKEEGTPADDRSAFVEIIDVLMIHPFWDMALLQVSGLPTEAKPLELSVVSPEELLDKDVVVVGYPAMDIRNDLDVQRSVFQNKFGVKRFQPGKFKQRQRYQSFGRMVNALTHDCSTLGGNSGSAVFDVASGRVVGLHFAGEYLFANYGVPVFELARDPRVVDAGLNFIGTVPPTNEFDEAWASVSGRTETQGTSISVGGVQSSSADTKTFHFAIPLSISVSVGAPAPGTCAQPTHNTGTVDSAEEKVPVIYPDLDDRSGYRSDFLGLAKSVKVPLLQLTSEGEALAAKLDDGSHILNYHRFSVVMHKKRRLALYTAANVDWRKSKREINGKKPNRNRLNGFDRDSKETWVTDPRIPGNHQLPDYFFEKDERAFDKGHLVRRDDIAWGDSFEDMQKGNGDTFHTTNCSPQVKGFNQAQHGDFNWGDLETMIEKETHTEKVCVFSGPVLDDKDRFFHGLVKSGVEVSIQIPRRFWKVIVADQGGKPEAFGFVLDQELSQVPLHEELTIPNAWKRFLRPLDEIEVLLRGLASFGEIKNWDKAS